MTVQEKTPYDPEAAVAAAMAAPRPVPIVIQQKPAEFDAAYMRRITAGFGALFSIALLLITLASVARAETLSVHGDWAAFKTAENGGTVCYIGSEPKKAEGDYSKRGDTYVLVTHRPSLKENDVVSVRAGYEYKPDSQVTVQIGGNTMNLFTKDGHAWAYDAKSDSELVRAMKRGSTMVVRGTSSRGTLTTDTYSLSGFTAAYNDSRKACGL